MKILVIFFVGFIAWAYGTETFRVGVYQPNIRTTSQKDFILGTTVMMKEITDKEGIKTVIRYYEDPLRMRSDFSDGKLDYISADALTIIRFIPEAELIDGIMSYKNNKNDAQTLVLLERSDDTRPFEEKLRGNIASDGDPVSEMFVLSEGMDRIKRSDIHFLPTKNGQQSILKLFFKQADLAITDYSSFTTAAELNPQIKSRLRIVSSTRLTIGPVAYMRKGISPDLRNRIIAVGKQLNLTPRGQQLLKMFRTSNLDDSFVSDLIPVRKLFDKYSLQMRKLK